MSALSDAETVRLNQVYGGVLKTSRRASWVPILSLMGVFAYLVYAWFAFNIPELIEKSRLDRGAVLALDTFAYKYNVTRKNRDASVQVDVEGARDTVQETPPSWVIRDGDFTKVDLADGYSVTMEGTEVLYQVPGGETFRSEIAENEIIVNDIRG